MVKDACPLISAIPLSETFPQGAAPAKQDGNYHPSRFVARGLPEVRVETTERGSHIDGVVAEREVPGAGGKTRRDT